MPNWHAYALVCVGLGLIFLRCLIKIGQLIASLQRGDVPEGPS